MGLFEELPLPDSKGFFDFAEDNDKAGALKYLQTLCPTDIEKEVLETGFSMISRRHGKPALMEYAINQIGLKNPVKREYN